jgi:cell division protein FtsB
MKRKQKKYKTKTKSHNYSRLSRGLNKILTVLIIGAALSYVIIINDLSIQGFRLKTLKEKKAELKKENEVIELEVAKLKSYENISQRAQAMKMVKVDSIDYITVTDSAVAKR